MKVFWSVLPHAGCVRSARGPQKNHNRIRGFHSHGRHLQAGGARHHMGPRGHGRTHHVLLDGLHNHRRPEHPIQVGHRVGRSVPGRDNRIGGRDAGYVPVRQRPLRARSRTRDVLVLRGHGLRSDGFHMAAGAVHGVHLRDHKHPDNSHQRAQAHHSRHPTQPPVRHIRRDRAVRRLHRAGSGGGHRVRGRNPCAVLVRRTRRPALPVRPRPGHRPVCEEGPRGRRSWAYHSA